MTQHNPIEKNDGGKQISLKDSRDVLPQGNAVAPISLSTALAYNPVRNRNSGPPSLPLPHTRPQYSNSSTIISSPPLRNRALPENPVDNQQCGPPPLPLHTRPQYSSSDSVASSSSLHGKSKTIITVADLEDALPAVSLTANYPRAVNKTAAPTGARVDPVLRQPHTLPRRYVEPQVTGQGRPSTPSKTLPPSPSYESYPSISDIDPTAPSRLIGTPGRRNNRWYVVIVGRQTGIFDDWLYTHSLVSGVSGNCHLSLATYDAAQAYYSANRDGRRIVRTSPQDEEIFGSSADAADVNWRGY